MGENIRRHRRALGLTQEQLGEKLGVSYQAISRWENGTAYPDIEFLPTLASFFEVSVDELLGYGEDERKKRADKLLEQLKSEPQDPVQVIEILREMRRDHLLDCGYDFWFVAGNFYRLPGVLPELRKTVEAILDRSTNKHLREAAIYHMACYEDDAHIEGFLKKHAALRDLTYNTLCRDRYEFRREAEKYEVMSQFGLRCRIADLIGNFQMGEVDRKLSAEEMLRVLRFQFDFLNRLCSMEPTAEHPVFCDTTVDEWSTHRVSMGLTLVGCLAATGDPEGAFAALEDIVSMLEQIMQRIAETPGGAAEVRVRCVWLDKARVTIKQFRDAPGEPAVFVTGWKFGEREGCIGDTEISEGGSGPDSAYFVLTSDKYRFQHMLDPIRSDPRYKAYVDRITAMRS